MSFSFSQLSLNGTAIGGITAAELDNRDRKDVRADDGQLHQTSATVMTTAPKATFTTVAVKSLIDLLTTSTHVPCLALNGTTGARMVGNKINSGAPGYDAGSVHAYRTMARGVVALDGLRWSRGGVLEANASIFGLSANGTTDPVADSTGALVTPPVNTQRLVLTALTINGVSHLAGAQSFELSINHRIENADETICYSGGLPFPILASQPGVGGTTEITATIEGVDLTTAAANGVVVATFTALNHNGVGLGSATVTVTLNGNLVRSPNNSGSTGQAARRRIDVHATYDGSTLPLSIATA